MKLTSIGSKFGAPAAVLVITASGLLGGISAASADGPKPGGTNLPLVTRNVTPATITSSGPRINVPARTVRLNSVQAGATGQGETDAQCQAREEQINVLYSYAARQSDLGTLAGKMEADKAVTEARREIDAAMDAGCWVIF
jgi:hypothetical protein